MPTAEEELLTKRARRSKRRGASFETSVVERLKSLGYVAQRKVLSGANLKRPYDVIVSPMRLKVECKRTLKDRITMQKKWLNTLTSKKILVFAIGSYAGKGQVYMYTAWSVPDNINLDKQITVVEISKTTGVKREGLPLNFFMRCGDKLYEVNSLEYYMSTFYPHKPETIPIVPGEGQT